MNYKSEIKVDIERKKLVLEETKCEDIYYNNFKAGAYSQGNVQTSHFTKLKNIEASTLCPEGNKFKEIKVKEFKTKEVLDDDVFYQDLFSTNFVYPSLREGSISKLKYTIELKEPRFFPYSFVCNYTPIENFEFTINSDKKVCFEFKYFNLDTLSIEYTKKISGNRIIYSWKSKNVPGYKKETRSPSLYYYLPQIIPYIKSYKVKDEEFVVLRNVDDLFNWYNANVKDIDHQHTPEMVSTVEALVKNCHSDFEKVNAIYRWVQNNIKYISLEYGLGGIVPRNPYQVFEKRYGDCKDMACVIVELLDMAGVKAYLTWIGSRDLPYTYEDIPTSLVDNHMIATYIENGNYYYLDATNPYVPIGIPNSFIQGKQALIRLNSDKYELKFLPVVESEKNYFDNTAYLNMENGLLNVKGLLKLGGYYGINLKQSIERIKDTKDKFKYLKSYLEMGNNKCQLDDYKLNPLDTELSINYKLNVADYVKVNGDEIFLNMNLTQIFNDFELFKDDRKIDYEFYYKSYLSLTYILKIPEGFEVSYLPKNTRFDNEDFYYGINYESKGDQVVYHFYFKEYLLFMKPALFAKWNKMLKSLRTEYKESIVLKKIK